MDAAYTEARRGGGAPRHATLCVVRIIKRNYCRAVVNNALLLKRVPATARARARTFRAASENRARARLSFFALRFVFRG